jgi:ribosome-binding protein aMBF1 (putative translation factor)
MIEITKLASHCEVCGDVVENPHQALDPNGVIIDVCGVCVFDKQVRGRGNAES